MKPLIALDYDGTCTTNVPFWANFIDSAILAGFEVLIVTMRYQWECEDIDPRISTRCEVFPTARQAKRDYCASKGIFPSIWIDDQPFFIYLDAEGAVPKTLEKSPLLPDYDSDIQKALNRSNHNI